MSETNPTAPLPRVLVVDDDQDVLDVLGSYLCRLFEVRSARSGREALEILQDWVPDTLVTDIRMPDMNGFMLLQEVGRIAPSVLTIAFSANIDPNDQRSQDIVARYANRALGKPVHPERLIEVIQEVLMARTNSGTR